MKHQKIDDQAHVWMVTRGCNGHLRVELDPRFVLSAGGWAEQVADALATAAGEMEIAESRLW